MVRTTQSVQLRVPRGLSAVSAMRVVVGWVGSCNDASVDELEDMNLALETVVSADHGRSGCLSLEVAVDRGVMQMVLTGLQSDALRANLEAEEDFLLSSHWPLDVRVFLGALVDDYSVSAGEENTFSVSMRKRLLPR